MTAYHSYSYAVGHKYFRRWRSIKKYLRRSDKTSDIEDAAAKCASESGIEPGHSLDFLGPPNLQLNLSSDPDSGTQKRIELFVAGTVAILLQAGLLVIACITVFYTPVKRVLAYEPPVYGLPCYVGGSVLLVLGMGLCSLAIEQSTKEYSWTRDKSQSYSSLNSSIGTLDSRKPKELEVEITNHDVRTASGKLKFQPRLFWLQQSHTVSDQSFDPYVILAGPRRYVITSSRVEEVKSDFSSQSTEEKVDWPDHRSQEDPRVSHLYADASIVSSCHRLSTSFVALDHGVTSVTEGATHKQDMGVADHSWRFLVRPRLRCSVHGSSRACLPMLHCAACRYLSHGASTSPHPAKTRTYPLALSSTTRLRTRVSRNSSCILPTVSRI